MLNAQDILKLLDPANHSLPKLTLDANASKYDVVYLPVFEETIKSAEKNFPAVKKLKLKGEKKESFEIAEGGQLLRVRGMGKKEEMTPRKIRRMFGSLFLGAEALKVGEIGLFCEEPEWVYLAAIGVHVASLHPNIFKPNEPRHPAPKVGFIHPSFKSNAVAEKDLQRGVVMAESKNLMRVLGATPPNSLSPATYATVIETLAKKWKVKCKNIPARDLKKYELLNAVSQGSGHDSKLLWLTLPGTDSKKCTVVVGKGLCYDSGGMQGKGNQMKTMKEDMAGSASLLGTILNLVKTKATLKQTTHFLLPLAENMMGTGAMRADDVYTAGDGQTVEIIHTDAEGRLVMGDAICYAKNNFKEIDTIYTIATLTGSCVVALGEVYTGVLCNDDKLREEVVKVGQNVGDLVFPGPWDLEYDDNNSPVADVANLGEKDRDAGWLKAGYYLARFVPKDKKTGKHTARFCHFDIAGSIDMDGSGGGHRRKGFNSGVGVGYLSNLLAK